MVEGGSSSGRGEFWKELEGTLCPPGPLMATCVDVRFPSAVLRVLAACAGSECLPFAGLCVTSDRGDIAQTRDSLVIAQLQFPWRHERTRGARGLCCLAQNGVAWKVHVALLTVIPHLEGFFLAPHPWGWRIRSVSDQRSLPLPESIAKYSLNRRRKYFQLLSP